MDSTWPAGELGAHALALPGRACLATGAQGRVAPADLRALAVPTGRRAGASAPGAAVDEYDGMAWVSFTPFLMAGLRPAAVPINPASPRSPRRTCAPTSAGPTGGTGYGSCPSRWAAPRCSRPAAPPTTSATSACPSTAAPCGVRALTCRRPVPPPHSPAGDPIQPSHRDIWLTGRWRAYTRRWGILFETPVEHEPWPLSTAVIEQLTETLLRSTGLPAPNQEHTCPTAARNQEHCRK